MKAYRGVDDGSTHSYYRYVTEVSCQPQRTASLGHGEASLEVCMLWRTGKFLAKV